jgi:hypothetical protein
LRDADNRILSAFEPKFSIIIDRNHKGQRLSNEEAETLAIEVDAEEYNEHVDEDGKECIEVRVTRKHVSI